MICGSGGLCNSSDHTVISSPRLDRQITENGGPDSFLLQVKTLEHIYDPHIVETEIFPDICRPVARVARTFWILRTVWKTRRRLAILDEPKRIRGTVSAPPAAFPISIEQETDTLDCPFSPAAPWLKVSGLTSRNFALRSLRGCEEWVEHLVFYAKLRNFVSFFCVEQLEECVQLEQFIVLRVSFSPFWFYSAILRFEKHFEFLWFHPECLAYTWEIGGGSAFPHFFFLFFSTSFWIFVRIVGYGTE